MSGWSNTDKKFGFEKQQDNPNAENGDNAQYDPLHFADGNYTYYNQGSSQNTGNGIFYNDSINNIVTNNTSPSVSASGNVFNSNNTPYRVGVPTHTMYNLQQPHEITTGTSYLTQTTQQSMPSHQHESASILPQHTQTYGHYPNQAIATQLRGDQCLEDIAQKYANSIFGEGMQSSNEVSTDVGSLGNVPSISVGKFQSGGGTQDNLADIVNRPKQENDNIIKDLILSIPSLSLESLTALEVLDRVDQKSKEVVTRYLPCVNFLVMCQQELRAALAVATQRRNARNGYKSGGMSTQQFYKTYLEPLPTYFFGQNQFTMDAADLKTAYEGIMSLLNDSKKVERTEKCEGMKNAFLGGMRDGESWGLRKWLSRNGGALQICNDLELILGALKKLPRDAPSSIHLAKRIRPLAKQSYDKLISDVPKAYQEISSAHPYLPFFHRLDSALKGLSEFDPEDDDVICLDDESECEGTNDTESNHLSAEGRNNCCSENRRKMKLTPGQDSSNSISNPSMNRISDGNDDGFVSTSPILFQDVAKYAARSDDDDKVVNLSYNDSDLSFNGKGEATINDADCHPTSDTFRYTTKFLANEKIGSNNKSTFHSFHMQTAQDLAAAIDNIAVSLEKGLDLRPPGMDLSDFWTHPCSNYIIVLRLFQKILLNTSSHRLLDPPISEDVTTNAKKYHQLIKNPLCFRDIVDALSTKEKGQLKCPNLKRWNVFIGAYLIQAVDLVFLNTLAFMGKNSSSRSDILSLRNSFWSEIRCFAVNDKKNIPVKRKEESSFVIRKS